MNRLVKISSIAGLIACVIIIVLSTNNEKLDKRLAYEQFLEQEFKNMNPQDVAPEKEDVKMTNPHMAALQDYYKTIDPTLKRVPTERLQQAYQKTKAIEKNSNLKFGANDISWTPIDSDMGGRTRAIMFDPNDVNDTKVWAGAVTGGLWYNDDISNASSPWVAVDGFWSNIAISSIVHDPNNTQHFYVGTGEAQTARSIYRESSGVGGGIWKTTDGGSTWAVIPSTTNFKYITDLVIRDENGTSVIYAGVTSGVYRGADHESTPSDGLYRSDDNGTTWTQVLPNIPNSTKPYAVADIKVGPNGRIFVGTMRNLDSEGGSNILYSDLGTSGSWTVYADYETVIKNRPGANNIPGRVIIAPSPSDENRVYALLGVGWVNSNNGFIHSQGEYILRSNDKGATWSEVNIPTGVYFWATLSWHAFEAAVDPLDPDELWVGGLDTYRTTNGGTTWTQMSDWRGPNYGYEYVHADIHGMIYNDNDPSKLLICTDGGMFYSSNANASSPDFESRNKSYGTLQFYSCDIIATAGQSKFVGGLQDNGTLLYTGNTLNEGHSLSGGDGAYCFFDQNENFIVTSIYYNGYYLFADYNYRYQHRDYYGTGTFINPADYDWKNNTLYANGTTFLRNYKNTFLRIRNFENANPTYDFVTLTSGVNVPFSHIKVSPHSPVGGATLYAGTESGRLFRIDNAHNALANAIEIGSSSFPTAYLSCVDVGMTADTVIATFSNYGVSSIWQTYDGGTTWQEKEGNLPDMPIRWIIYNPHNAKKAMIATETGVWFTDELDQASPNWVPVNTGLANVRVDMLKVRENDYTVLAATHGRGLAVASFGPLGIDDPKTVDETFGMSPNPATDFINVKLQLDEPENVQINIFDQNGRVVADYDEGTQSGYYQKIIRVSHLQAGNYIFKLSTPTKVLTQKLIIQ